MVRAAHTAESGTEAADLTTAISGGTYSDDAFDTVFKGAGTTIKTKAVALLHDALGFEIVGAASVDAYMEYGAKLGTLTSVFMRGNFKFPTIPSGNVNLIRVQTSAGVLAWGVRLFTTGKIAIFDANQATSVKTSALTAGAVARIEVEAVAGTVSGSVTLRLYKTLDATTPDDTISVTSNVGADFSKYRVGAMPPAATAYTFYVDDICWQDGSQPGAFLKTLGSAGVVGTAEAIGKDALSITSSSNQRYGWQPSGIDAGGHVNVLSVDPSNSGWLVCGGDVSAVHMTTDGGQSWTPKNNGRVDDAGGRGVAGLARTTAAAFTGRVWAICSTGIVMRSTDYGQTWNQVSSTGPPVQGAGPRARALSNRYVAVDDSGASIVLYSASSDGLWRSRDEGATWTRIGLPGAMVTTAVRDSTTGKLYIGLRGTTVGAYEVVNPNSVAPTFNPIASAPLDVEEFVIVGTRLWAACGNSGVWASPAGAFAGAWTNLSGNLPVPTTFVAAIDGVMSGGSPLLLVSTKDPVRLTGDTGFSALWSSADSGATWTSLTRDTTKIHNTIYNAAGIQWWAGLIVPLGPNYLGKKGYEADSVVIDPFDFTHFFSAGNQGIWHSANSGGDWFPLDRKLNLTVNISVGADPSQNSTFMTGNADHAGIETTDGYSTVRQVLYPATTSARNGFGMAWDRSVSPARIFMGVGNDDNSGGEIFSAASTQTPDPWQSEAFTAFAGGARPRSLVWGKDAAGSSVLVVGAEAFGLARRVAGGSWTMATLTDSDGTVLAGPTACPLDTLNGHGWASPSLAWAAGGAYVYYYDPLSGVWRSSDYGVSFQRIWKLNNATVPLGALGRSGYLAADPTNAARIFVSAPSGLYLVSDARTGTVEATPAKAVSLSVSEPGPIAVGPTGRLYVCRRVAGGRRAQFLISDDAGTTFTDNADGVYQNQEVVPNAIAVSPDGIVALADSGIGLCVGTLGAALAARTIQFAGVVGSAEAVGIGHVFVASTPSFTISNAGAVPSAEAVGIGETVSTSAVVRNSWFMPPISAGRKPADWERIPKAPQKSNRYRSAFISANLGVDTIIGTDGTIYTDPATAPASAFRFRGGRWNGPLTDAQTSAITAAGYAARIFSSRYGYEGVDLPAWIDG